MIALANVVAPRAFLIGGVAEVEVSAADTRLRAGAVCSSGTPCDGAGDVQTNARP